jgi:predicted RNA binding protein YcfA (HicA-like mRNA interferase family)
VPELPRVSGAEAIRALEQLGFSRARQRGSHVVLKRRTSSGEVGCVVPLHREIAVGTLRGILRQAEVDREEFIASLKHR